MNDSSINPEVIRQNHFFKSHLKEQEYFCFPNGMQYDEEVTLGVVELSRYSSIAPWRCGGDRLAVQCGAVLLNLPYALPIKYQSHERIKKFDCGTIVLTIYRVSMNFWMLPVPRATSPLSFNWQDAEKCTIAILDFSCTTKTKEKKRRRKKL